MLFLAVTASLLSAQFAFAEDGIEAAATPAILLDLITLVVIGGTLFNLYIGSTGMGGQIGSALKVISGGIILLSLEVLDEVIETLTGFGSENLFGEGALHDIVHHGIILLGFVLLSIGMAKIAKLVKTIKG